MSLHRDAPRAEAISTSRPRPVIRENNIPKLFVKIDLRRMYLFDFDLRYSSVMLI